MLELGPSKTCEWIGPEQKEYPFTKCGQNSITGKSYCAEHYHRMYQKGSSATGARKMEKLIERELADLELSKLIAEQEADVEELNV